MTEQELRALVRDTVARHLGSSPDATSASTARLMPSASIRQHASHALFVLPAGDGPCLIEPTVACNHCGYCKSYGH
jgi:hypothetical protein